MTSSMNKCERCWGALQDAEREDVCKECEFKLNRPERFLEWKFRYRAYKKQRAIQLKPYHDKENHFSIVWTKDKKTLTVEAFDEIDAIIRNYFKVNGNVLHFRIIRACKNCTYGRFEQSFEDLILDLRSKYPLCSNKDLTLDDPKHQFLKTMEEWDSLHPIIHHIHSQSDDLTWTDFMRNSSRNSVLTLIIEFED